MRPFTEARTSRNPAQRTFAATRSATAGSSQSQPVEATAPIAANVGQLFYFTEVEGGPATIQHVWIWKDQTMATVSLEVKSPRYRTWSSKRIQPEWTGQWRIEARTSDGTVLSSHDFVVE